MRKITLQDLLLNMGIALIVALVFLAAEGCRAQVPPNPTTYTCPVTTGSAYTPLNAPNGTPSLTYADTPTTAGQYCYIAQSVIQPGGQASNPSNTTGAFNVTMLTGAKTVNLSWSAPTTGPTPTGYVISRAPAISSTLLAPSLGTGTLAERAAPQLKPNPGAGTKELASVTSLRAQLR